MKTLEDWIAKYESKTTEKVELNDGFHLFFLPDKGFCKIRVDTSIKTVMIKETCGDGKYWHSFAIDIANKLDLDKIAVFVCRNINAYFRLFGGIVTVDENGFYKGKDKEGRVIEGYPYNNSTYFVVQYLR